MPETSSIFRRSNGIWIYALAFVPPLIALTVASVQNYIPLAYLMKDPLAVAELTKGDCCHVYYGLFSNVGILMWCGGAAITLFSALVLTIKSGKQSDIIPLTAAGLFTTWLMLDDFFLVHEDVFPAFGISQPVTYTFYACLAIGYFVFAWRTILGHRPVLLLLSLVFLGLSVGLDVVLHTEGYLHVLLEDGAKLLGISAWTAFHIDLALSKMDQALSMRHAPNTSPRLHNAAATISNNDLLRG